MFVLRASHRGVRADRSWISWCFSCHSAMSSSCSSISWTVSAMSSNLAMASPWAALFSRRILWNRPVMAAIDD